MKKASRGAAFALVLIGMVPNANAASVEHYYKTVSLLEVADTTCIFFQLTGVTQANPVVPNVSWFAIEKTQGNAKEMYALLLSARLSGTTLTRVQTSGDIVCGQAKVLTIDL